MSRPVDVAEHFIHAAARFTHIYHRPPRFGAVAPGRVNLIGEHTDYNEGFVLPMAIERQTIILADRRSDGVACICSNDADQEVRFPVNEQLTPAQPAWSNYVRGAVHGCLQSGLNPGGFDGLIDSTVPIGGGLSSSAALEVATITMIEAMCARSLAPKQKALLAQKAEHDFAGVPCGIMDQFAAVLGQANHLLLIDCRAQESELVAVNDNAIAFLIINSNVKHELTGGAYAQRRNQCEVAARQLGAAALRDVDITQLVAKRDALEPVCYRRALHILTENQRVLDAAAALKNRDWAGLGQLMLLSHASMRDDFQISCPEIDLLVELASKLIPDGGVWGSRMTGGGFGGCTISVVNQQAVEAITATIGQQYKDATGIEPTIFATQPADGARILDC